MRQTPQIPGRTNRDDIITLQSNIIDVFLRDPKFEDQFQAVMSKLRQVREAAIIAASLTAGGQTLSPADISNMIDVVLNGFGFPGLGDRVYVDFDQREKKREAALATSGLTYPTLQQPNPGGSQGW